MELEAKIASGDVGVPRIGAAVAGDVRVIPRGPARSSLSGHRGTINSLAIHPVYRFNSNINVE